MIRQRLAGHNVLQKERYLEGGGAEDDMRISISCMIHVRCRSLCCTVVPYSSSDHSSDSSSCSGDIHSM